MIRDDFHQKRWREFDNLKCQTCKIWILNIPYHKELFIAITCPLKNLKKAFVSSFLTVFGANEPE